MFEFYKLIHFIKKTISYIGVERALVAMFTSLLSNLFKLYEYTYSCKFSYVY